MFSENSEMYSDRKAVCAVIKQIKETHELEEALVERTPKLLLSAVSHIGKDSV